MAQHLALTAADTAWLHMERASGSMCITALMVFEEALTIEALREVVQKRLLIHERFRMRVVEPPLHLGPPHWEEDPGFDLHTHLHRLALPEPGDEAALKELVNDLISTRLDMSRPLWQLHLVEGYRGSGPDQERAGCALVARIHHAIGDGVSLVRLLLSLTDEGAAATLPQAVGQGAQAGDPAARAEGLMSAFLHEGWESLRHPEGALERAKSGLVKGLTVGAEGAAALGRLLLLPPDPPSVFKGPLGAYKKVAWSSPFPLARVKATGKALGATINDVLIASMSGALRRYASERGRPTEEDLRTLVPVNLRPIDEHLVLGNHFGMIFLELPLSVADPVERLRELKRRMDVLKAAPDAVISFAILVAMGVATPLIEGPALAILSEKASAVMTNVPGPREEVSLAGRKVHELMFWVPQAGEIALGVSILSYAGSVRLSVAADAGVLPEVEELVAAFNLELAAIEAAVGQHDPPHSK